MGTPSIPLLRTLSATSATIFLIPSSIRILGLLILPFSHLCLIPSHANNTGLIWQTSHYLSQQMNKMLKISIGIYPWGDRAWVLPFRVGSLKADGTLQGKLETATLNRVCTPWVGRDLSMSSLSGIDKFPWALDCRKGMKLKVNKSRLRGEFKTLDSIARK